MFKLICVTNRTMCSDLAKRAAALYKSGVEVILREKDLSENEYERLAKKVIEVCSDVTLHTYINAAKRLGAERIHLPLNMMTEEVRRDFKTVGLSIHSVADAVKAEALGADYVTAGHVFVTDCKKGIAPRGLDFLKNTVCAVHIPVYAIGGVTPDNIASVRNAGAAGACLMSGFMRCKNAEEYIKRIKRSLNNQVDL